jgi:hypothetical protein
MEFMTSEMLINLGIYGRICNSSFANITEILISWLAEIYIICNGNVDASNVMGCGLHKKHLLEDRGESKRTSLKLAGPSSV